VTRTVLRKKRTKGVNLSPKKQKVVFWDYWKKDASCPEEFANAMGAQGWELVCHDPAGWLWFKRPKAIQK